MHHFHRLFNEVAHSGHFWSVHTNVAGGQRGRGWSGAARALGKSQGEVRRATWELSPGNFLPDQPTNHLTIIIIIIAKLLLCCRDGEKVYFFHSVFTEGSKMTI